MNQNNVRNDNELDNIPTFDPSYSPKFMPAKDSEAAKYAGELVFDNPFNPLKDRDIPDYLNLAFCLLHAQGKDMYALETKSMARDIANRAVWLANYRNAVVTFFRNKMNLWVYEETPVPTYAQLEKDDLFATLRRTAYGRCIMDHLARWQLYTSEKEHKTFTRWLQAQIRKAVALGFEALEARREDLAQIVDTLEELRNGHFLPLTESMYDEAGPTARRERFQDADGNETLGRFGVFERRIRRAQWFVVDVLSGVDPLLDPVNEVTGMAAIELLAWALDNKVPVALDMINGDRKFHSVDFVHRFTARNNLQANVQVTQENNVRRPDPKDQILGYDERYTILPYPTAPATFEFLRSELEKNPERFTVKTFAFSSDPLVLKLREQPQSVQDKQQA
jgi:hypothetical protein